MPKATNKLEIPIDKERENKMFSQVLADNVHLSKTQHTLVRVWCRLMIAIENMPASRELREMSKEARLLGNSLKLMPTVKQDKTVDLATRLQQEVRNG